MRVARGFDVLGLAAAPLAGPPARQRLRRQALDLARAEGLVDAAYSYRLVPLAAPAAARLRLDGEALFAPRLLPASGQLTGLACAVCTLGPGLEARVRALFGERRAALAVALDALGNELLLAVSRRAQDQIQADAARRGLSLAGELRAGDPGLALDAQAAVLRLARAARVGVSLSRGELMQPIKSTSMLLGVGIDLPASRWSRCDDCRTRAKCALAARAPVARGEAAS